MKAVNIKITIQGKYALSSESLCRPPLARHQRDPSAHPATFPLKLSSFALILRPIINAISSPMLAPLMNQAATGLSEKAGEPELSAPGFLV